MGTAVDGLRSVVSIHRTSTKVLQSSQSPLATVVVVLYP